MTTKRFFDTYPSSLVHCSCGESTVVVYNSKLGRYEATAPRWKFSIETYGWTCGTKGHRQVSDEEKPTQG